MTDLKANGMGSKNADGGAGELIVSGCSAGGLALWLHLDYIADYVGSKMHIVGIPESGFFMDENTNENTFFWTDLFQHISEMQNVTAAPSNLNAGCLAAATPQTKWKCFMAQ